MALQLRTTVIYEAQTEPEHLVDLGVRLSIFLALQLIGLIGSVVVLLTAPFSSVGRQMTWYNFFISWMVFCTSYLLLFFAGQGHNREPPFALCLTQSSLTYAAPPYAAAATLCLVVQLYFNVYTSLTGKRIKGERFWNLMVSDALPHFRPFNREEQILILPYVVFSIVMIESLVVRSSPVLLIVVCDIDGGWKGGTGAGRSSFLDGILLQSGDSHTVCVRLENFLICELKKLPQGKVNCCTCGVIHCSCPGTQCYHLSAAQEMFLGPAHRQSFPNNVHPGYDLFGFRAGLLFFFVVFIQDSVNGLADLDIVLACIPIAAVLIFGTHEDLLQIWLFWKKGKVIPASAAIK
ncbi:hypothetical protein D9758_014170 [Tetrapyrgos nigripes]|uniref:Uncharacterized protein n=1 Tax=Tetrapyrgos nigripes TaxID=182062 RepID=A0A8H5CKC5_9AGAR|nr:hypothetical protein D9758_014170 [Tetrapyrgos nigripes]